jgi:hypothetical protein
MKRLLAFLSTVVVMGVMLWTGLRRPETPTASRSQTEPAGRLAGPDLGGVSERIESLLDVARRGDVGAYLGSFEGSLRARLERLAGERGRAVFAAELRRTAEARKSHAIFQPAQDGPDPDSARIIVESTYADRIERQIYRLVRLDSGWIITDVEAARNRVPGKAIGSLATYQEPEAVPVARDQTSGITADPSDAGEN